jgi:phosphate-selective porin
MEYGGKMLHSRSGMRLFDVRFLATLLVLTAGISAQIFQEPLATFSGVVQEIDSRKLALQDADSNTLQFVLTHKTRYYAGSKKIKASDIKKGDRVSIETKRFPDGELEAINVRLEPKTKTPGA